MNIILSSMKGITPLITLLALYINITQEESTKMIVKNYATMALLSNIDNMFVKTLPLTVVKEQRELNKK